MEIKRREEEINEKKRKDLQLQQDTIQRRKLRAKLREELRLDELQQNIMASVVQQAIREEFKTHF
jgi:hypothetical protein